MNELRIAIVGCGKIADQHAEQIRRIAGSRVVAVCDREKLMADQLAERFQIEQSFADIDQLLNAARPHVVHITTPPQSHFELTRKCLRAGCHVYVEKPFSIDAQEARGMVALAEERGLKLTAGHNVQFNPEMIRMRELVRKGILGGAPVHIESVFSYHLGAGGYAKALLGDETHWVRALPGKLLQNLISHGIAKVAEFIDSSEITVSASGFTSPDLRSAGETDIVDELRVVISDNQRCTAYFTFTTRIVPPVQELRVFGPKGSVIVDNLHRSVVALDRSNSDYKSYLNFFVPPVNVARQHLGNLWRNAVAFMKSDSHMDAGMKNLIEAFHRSIQSDGPPPIPYREILLTASIMDDIFCQLGARTQKTSAGSAGEHVGTVLSGERA